jgi:hypothetical protein
VRRTAEPVETAVPTRPPRGIGQAIALGAFLAASLDGLECSLLVGILGGPIPRVFQGVAAGVLGREAARSGGLATALLGAVLLVVICALVVAIYVFARRRVDALGERLWLWGPLYGAVVFAVMQFVVVPLSAARGGTPTLVGLLNGLAVNVLWIGPVAAWVARDVAPAGRRVPVAVSSRGGSFVNLPHTPATAGR